MTQEAQQAETTAAPYTGEEEPSEYAGELVQTSRDDLMEAVKAARAELPTEEQEAATPDPNADKPKPPSLKAAKASEEAEKTAAPGEEDDLSIPALQRKIRQREKARAITLEAEQRAADAQRRATEVEQREAALKQREAELNGKFDLFTKDPLAFLKEGGWDRDKVAEAFVKQGTPEYELRNRLEATEKKYAELVDYLRGDAQRRQDEARTAEETRLKNARVEAERKFLADHATPEVAPNLHKIAKLTGQAEQYIVAKADKVAEWYKAQTGAYPTWDEIVEYLESDATKNFQEVTGAKPQASKPAGKPKATTRTLSNDLGSERRSAPKTADELSPEELREELKKAAAEARRSA